MTEEEILAMPIPNSSFVSCPFHPGDQCLLPTENKSIKGSVLPPLPIWYDVSTTVLVLNCSGRTRTNLVPHAPFLPYCS